jgi:propionate CoA-transferase
MRKKIVTAAEAAALIRNGSTVATDGFIGAAFPEELAVAVEERFLKTGEPNNLTLVYGAGQGDGKTKGNNHFGHEGLIRRVIGGHWGLVPMVQQLAINNKIEAYNFPQGVISHMFRDIAAKKPATITSVGLRTFVDPRVEGGKLNDITKENLVELIEIHGKEYLLYSLLPIDFVMLRGTTADTNGNITVEKEALTLEMLPAAQAAKNSGGQVVVQVERIVEAGRLHAKDVVIPGIFVDMLVVSTKPEYHMQTFRTIYNPAFCGEGPDIGRTNESIQENERNIVCRRAAMEMRDGDIINIGIGMPEGIGAVIREKSQKKDFVATVEAGPIGGVPASGLDFGYSSYPEAIISQSSQFDFYQGGGLDVAFLGLAQADRQGNVNVSKFGPKIAGCGGFIDISQNAKRVIYCGTFTAGGLVTEFCDGNLHIVREGQIPKFVSQVEQITFSGVHAVETGQSVLYITERAVFRLTPDGLSLIEIAPGISIEKDILPHMSFRPVIPEHVKIMDTSAFEH